MAAQLPILEDDEWDVSISRIKGIDIEECYVVRAPNGLYVARDRKLLTFQKAWLFDSAAEAHDLAKRLSKELTSKGAKQDSSNFIVESFNLTIAVSNYGIDL